MQRALGIDDRLRWVTTQMGLFYNDKLYPLGDPLSLLAFPHLTVRDKARFAAVTLRSVRRGPDEWKDIEHLSARDWLVSQYGENTYRMLYQPLLDSKFGALADQISASWMWARLYRLGNSRTITQKERIGYLEGGSQLYIDALERAIRSRGVEVRTATTVEQVVVEGDRATGVQIDGRLEPFDSILSTVPIPYTRQLFAGIEGPYFDNLRTLPYIGVVVMLLRLKRRFSRYFWMNVSDPRLALAGIIEYTNLNPYPALGGDTSVYIPQYLAHSDPRFGTPNEELFASYCAQLQTINPEFDPSWVVQYWVHRDRFAQPICEIGFSQRIPSMQTPVRNLFLTDSYQLHPHDRSISDSTALGQNAARLMLGSRSPSESEVRGGAARVGAG
jgi:protoporphyrinogen oxidase